MPVISVVMPARDAEKYISDAVESILNQTFKDFELIIVNDGSTDKTLSIIESKGDDRIKIISTEGIGLVDSLNLGIASSQGDLIARMDADDIACLGRLEEQYSFLLKNRSYNFICSDVMLINTEGAVIGSHELKVKDNYEFIRGLTLKSQFKPIIHPSVMFKKDLFDKVSGYRKYLAAEDRDLWLRMLHSNAQFAWLNKPLLKYRVNPNGESSTKRSIQKANSLLAIFCFEIMSEIGEDVYRNDEIYNSFQNYFMGYANNWISDFESFNQCKSKLRKGKLCFNFLSAIRYYLFRNKKDRYIVDKAKGLYLELNNRLN